MMPYIYVLHFHTRLAHAEHYVGSTQNLKARLAAHAEGHGSRLTRELHRRGTAWTLSALYETSKRNQLRIERTLKQQKNGPRYCTLCNPDIHPLPGTTQYPIDHVPFPTDSREIEGVTPTIRLDTHRAINHCDTLFHELTRTEKQLGHLTHQAYVTHCKQGNVQIAYDCNGDKPVGYLIATINRKANHLTICQTAVVDEYRLYGIGKALVREAQWRHPLASVSCKVRSDLQANHFWKAIGFMHVRTTTHPTSKSQLNNYTHSPIIES